MAVDWWFVDGWFDEPADEDDDEDVEDEFDVLWDC